MSIPRIATLALAALPMLAADVYTIDPTHSEAAFQVRHIVTKVRGRFTDFSGTIRMDRARPEASAVEFRIRTTSIDTALADRDKHLRSADFFDVEKYPEIVFQSSGVSPAGKDRYNVSGNLTIRGVSKAITLPVTFLGGDKDPWGNERAGFETSLTLNRKDFGMVWNKSLDSGGLLVGEEVAVSINLEALKAKGTSRSE